MTCRGGGGVVYDECGRECACVNGKMTECFRVRKEFTSLSNEEKTRYLQAYYKITTEEPLKSRFVTFIKKHNIWFFKGLHNIVHTYLIMVLSFWQVLVACIPTRVYILHWSCCKSLSWDLDILFSIVSGSKCEWKE